MQLQQNILIFFNKKNRELEEELEATLNFLRKITMSTTKPIPQVIVISKSKEEVEIKLQHVVEENSKLVPMLRLVEEGKLQ
jgi:sugar-specific transcriptional regulator TrmB